MSEHLQTYQILEGVRRAKAYALSGFESAVCKVYRPDATFVGEMEIRIDQLRSRKSVIDISDPKKRERFDRIARAIAAGRQIDPIAVEEGARGCSIADIEFDTEGMT
ncbi:MAG: hypothetical protein AB7U20_10650 [Planctomycetaceae bacterium]